MLCVGTPLGDALRPMLRRPIPNVAPFGNHGFLDYALRACSEGRFLRLGKVRGMAFHP